MARAGFTGDPEEDGDPEGTAERQLEEDALSEIEGLSLHELLAKGHETLLRRLVAKSMAGTIAHQEQAILRNLLRDNGMTGGMPAVRTIEHRKPAELPNFSDPDYDA